MSPMPARKKEVMYNIVDTASWMGRSPVVAANYYIDVDYKFLDLISLLVNLACTTIGRIMFINAIIVGSISRKKTRAFRLEMLV